MRSSPPRRSSTPPSPGSPAVDLDDNQVLAYELAHAAAGVMAARACSTTAPRATSRPRSPAPSSPTPSRDLGAQAVRPRGRVGRRDRAPSTAPGASSPPTGTPAFLAALADVDGPAASTSDFEMVQDTFRRFAEEKLVPIAEHIHRHNADIPEDIISGLAEMGAFGLSIPEEYGGFAVGRRVRLHRHGRRHRGAEPGQPRCRRLAHHPARDPRPGPRGRRHRGAEAGVAAPSWPPPRS